MARDDFEYNGVTLLRTCYACPEQYDAYIGNKQVGYFRLRHGYFRVDNDECGGDLAYEGYPEGDGIFDDEERETFLRSGIDALLEFRAAPPPKPQETP